MEESAGRRGCGYVIGASAVFVVVAGLVYFATAERRDSEKASTSIASAPWPDGHPRSGHAPSDGENMQQVDLAPQRFRVKRLKGRAFLMRQSFDARPGDVRDVVATLLPLAESGDEIAAFEIYRKVSACRDELAMALESASSTDPESLISEGCRSIPVGQWRSYTARWLEAAAEKDFLPAQLAYAIDARSVVGSGPDLLSDPDAVAAYRRKAMSYMHRAASTGSVDALSMLAGAYASGILTKQDPTLAYAYFNAAGLATGSNDSIHELMRQRYEIGLTRSDIQRATQQGRSIYEECCSP